MARRNTSPEPRHRAARCPLSLTIIPGAPRLSIRAASPRKTRRAYGTDQHTSRQPRALAISQLFFRLKILFVSLSVLWLGQTLIQSGGNYSRRVISLITHQFTPLYKTTQGLCCSKNSSQHSIHYYTQMIGSAGYRRPQLYTPRRTFLLQELGACTFDQQDMGCQGLRKEHLPHSSPVAVRHRAFLQGLWGLVTQLYNPLQVRL